MLFEQLRKQWDAHGSRAPLHAALTFVDDWLVLGAGTRLALAKRGGCSPRKRRRPRQRVALRRLRTAARTPRAPLYRASNRQARRRRYDARLDALGDDRPVAADPTEASGLSAIHGRRLDEGGHDPRDVCAALDFDSAPIERIEKYSPDQPRVPAGNGRPSGQWTRDGAGDAATPTPLRPGSRKRQEHRNRNHRSAAKAGSSGSHEFYRNLRNASRAVSTRSDSQRRQS